MDLHVGWDELASAFRAAIAETVEATVPRGAPHHQQALDFAAGRIDEGRRVGEYFATIMGRPLRFLDVGSGNGGVSLGVGNIVTHDVHAIDLVPNFAFRRFRRSIGASHHLTQTVGSGHAIPFADETFDVVLCLETLEHIPDPPALGREIMRVLRPGGACMIMTPARVKHLLRPDPHYGIRGLLLLPDALQRWVVVDWLRRTTWDLYDVEHTFWTLRGIADLFPGHRDVEPLFEHPQPPGTLWYRYRDLLWDRVVIHK